MDRILGWAACVAAIVLSSCSEQRLNSEMDEQRKFEALGGPQAMRLAEQNDAVKRNMRSYRDWSHHHMDPTSSCIAAHLLFLSTQPYQKENIAGMPGSITNIIMSSRLQIVMSAQTAIARTAYSPGMTEIVQSNATEHVATIFEMEGRSITGSQRDAEYWFASSRTCFNELARVLGVAPVTLSGKKGASASEATYDLIWNGTEYSVAPSKDHPAKPSGAADGQDASPGYRRVMIHGTSISTEVHIDDANWVLSQTPDEEQRGFSDADIRNMINGRTGLLDRRAAEVLFVNADKLGWQISDDQADLLSTIFAPSTSLSEDAIAGVSGEAPDIGTDAIVPSGSIEPQPELPATVLSVSRVGHDDTLSVRAAPSPQAEKVGDIPYDADNVAWFGETHLSGTSTWYLIDFKGKVGWVNSYYLTPSRNEADTTEGVTDSGEVSSTASTSDPRDFVRPTCRQANQEVLCMDKNGNWSPQIP